MYSVHSVCFFCSHRLHFPRIFLGGIIMQSIHKQTNNKPQKDWRSALVYSLQTVQDCRHCWLLLCWDSHAPHITHKERKYQLNISRSARRVVPQTRHHLTINNNIYRVQINIEIYTNNYVRSKAIHTTHSSTHFWAGVYRAAGVMLQYRDGVGIFSSSCLLLLSWQSINNNNVG